MAEFACPVATEVTQVLEFGATQQDTARALGISPQYLSDLIHQRRGVGARVALLAQETFGIDAMSILIRQAAHDLARESTRWDAKRQKTKKKR